VEAIFTAGAPDEDLPIPRQVIAEAYGAALINSEDYKAFCAKRGLSIVNSEDL
jgi:hypothetical protein